MLRFTSVNSQDPCFYDPVSTRANTSILLMRKTHNILSDHGNRVRSKVQVTNWNKVSPHFYYWMLFAKRSGVFGLRFFSFLATDSQLRS